MKKLVLTLATASILFASGHSVAVGTAGGTLQVTALVTSSCTIATLPVAFGSYDATAASAKTGTGTITLTCVGTSSATLTLNNGLHFGTTRNMRGVVGNALLAYGLFKPVSDAAGAACAYAIAFGSAAGEEFVVTGITLAPRAISVCGSAPTGQNVNADNYADTVTVTATF